MKIERVHLTQERIDREPSRFFRLLERLRDVPSYIGGCVLLFLRLRVGMRSRWLRNDGIAADAALDGIYVISRSRR